MTEEDQQELNLLSNKIYLLQKKCELQRRLLLDVLKERATKCPRNGEYEDKRGQSEAIEKIMTYFNL